MFRWFSAAFALATTSIASADLVIDSALGTTLDVSHSVGSVTSLLTWSSTLVRLEAKAWPSVIPGVAPPPPPATT